ncbi:hypothetical protein GCM10011316_09790 [Roseibium aquae]|uniref:Uncharacterized protein n=1 Tax=Roseibium aquae TaxID=1323746 RepID=A0A916TCA0_9HYPH|nr:hypothetical protein [Roseibium aquae]GGB39805.1 hypothetical protein GCM10011316_09790 [Roseibium aquae]
MPEGIGYSSAQALSQSTVLPQNERMAEKAEAVRTRQGEAVAEIVGRQAQFSSSRAETLARQAEQLENRVETRNDQNGLGNRVNLVV